MKFKRDNPQDKAWADWLSDTTPAVTDSTVARPKAVVSQTNRTSSVRRPTIDGIRAQFKNGPKANRLSDASAIAPAATASRANITLNIQVPDMASVKRLVGKLPWRRIRLAALTVVAVVAVLVGGMYLLSVRKDAIAKAAARAENTAPGFTPLVSQSATKDGTTAGTNYEPAKKLYVYHDTYQGIDITVSQQPMPASIKSPESKLADIAHSIGASEKMQTSVGSVFYTQPGEDGSQRVVFTNKEVLVFASSNGTMTARDWVTYVQSLD